MKRLHYFAFILLFALGGCSDMPNLRGADHVNPDELSDESSFIVVSSTADTACLVGTTVMILQPVGSAYLKDSLWEYIVNARMLKSDFDGVTGNLYVKKLKPGNYRFYPKRMSSFIKGVSIPGAEFVLKPREVVYLGETHMEKSCEMQQGFIVLDSERRDLEALRNINPQFRGKNVTKRLLSFKEGVFEFK